MRTEHRLGDRQRLRQTQSEGDALAAHRVDVHRAAELTHFVAHHVHAHATASQLADLLGGAETGGEDQAIQFGIAELLAGLDQAALFATATDRITVQPGAVVGYFQHDFRAFAAKTDRDAAFFRLARIAALLGRFQPVRHRVTQHVFQRRDHAIEHVAIEFALGAFQQQMHLLASVVGRLTHHTAQTPAPSRRTAPCARASGRPAVRS